MKKLIWLLVFLLIVAHQNYWMWDDATLFWGFMPAALLYQAGISVAASLVWLFAVLFAWPKEDALSSDSSSVSASNGALKTAPK